MCQTTKHSKQLEPEQVDRLEETVRDLVRHENDLVNQRIGWLVQTQGLLFAALAFAWEKVPGLSYILAALGIASAISIGSAISLYSPAVRGLEDWWNERVPEHQRKNRLVIGLSKRSAGLARLLRPWRALPLVFIAAWVGVVIMRLAT